VHHSASMRLGRQREARTVLPQGRSTRSGHSRGVLFHHKAQVVEQYTPGHTPESLQDPRLMAVPGQGAPYALCLPVDVVRIFQ
jgi:hypothetical protein